jgi:hypothetical protein
MIGVLSKYVASAFLDRIERCKESRKIASQRTPNLPGGEGHIEGQITRLKILKHQMHVRAGFDILHAA